MCQMEVNRRVEGGKNIFSNTNNKYLEVFENKFVHFKTFFLEGGVGGVIQSECRIFCATVFALSTSITLKPDSTMIVLIWRNYSSRTGYSFYCPVLLMPSD